MLTRIRAGNVVPRRQLNMTERVVSLVSSFRVSSSGIQRTIETWQHFGSLCFQFQLNVSPFSAFGIALWLKIRKMKRSSIRFLHRVCGFNSSVSTDCQHLWWLTASFELKVAKHADIEVCEQIVQEKNRWTGNRHRDEISNKHYVTDTRSPLRSYS